VLQKFRSGRARQGQRTHAAGDPRATVTYFDLLPFWYAPIEAQATDNAQFPSTPSPSADGDVSPWDSQNAWLRQIHTHNHLFVNPKVAHAAGIEDGAGCGSTARGKVRACSYRRRSSPAPSGRGTRSAGARGVSRRRQRKAARLLLNHLISEELPGRRAVDVQLHPITGQAA
jgi:hypothetical protein